MSHGFLPVRQGAPKFGRLDAGQYQNVILEKKLYQSLPMDALPYLMDDLSKHVVQQLGASSLEKFLQPMEDEYVSRLQNDPFMGPEEKGRMLGVFAQLPHYELGWKIFNELTAPFRPDKENSNAI